MYEDVDLWPIKCPHCLNEFTEQIGRIKTQGEAICIDCGTRVTAPTEQFLRAIAEAKETGLDPWRDMISIRKTDKF